jgi:cytochrome b pre-mRNA-processing protein 3
MIFGFIRKDPRAPLIERLQGRIADAAREPDLYLRLGAADTLEGRFELVALHLILVLRRLRQLPPPADEVAQEIVDAFFRELDASLREMGVGDMGVPKRMKKLAQAFYGRARAYDRALDRVDPQAVAAALSEHLGGLPENLQGLARYALEAESELVSVSLHLILERGPPFPPPGAVSMEDAQ